MSTTRMLIGGGKRQPLLTSDTKTSDGQKNQLNRMITMA
jgi:hypothetical protein